MKKTLWLLIVLAGIGLGTGCAGLSGKAANVVLEVSPPDIYPGTVVRLTAKSPLPAVEMRGRLDMLGSPVVALRSQDQGLTWTFLTQIPIDAVWQPGRYRAVVEGQTAAGEPLWGEAWIIAH